MKALLKFSCTTFFTGVLFLGTLGHAQEVVVDFEDQDIQASITTLEINTPQLTVTITRKGTMFGVVDPQNGAFGQRTLTPFPNIMDPHFVADFSAPVSSVSFDTGDTGAPFLDLDILTVEAFSEPGAQGTKLKTETSICCSEFGFSTGTITISAPGIKSISFIGGSAFQPNSVFYDNFALVLENQVEDVDGDNIPDDQDPCKASDLSEKVVIDGCDSGIDNVWWYNTGCTTSDYVTACAANAKNHGHFVKCVSQFTQSFTDHSFLSSKDKGAIQSCAAQASLP